MIERVRFEDGQAADRRECSVCGEQWMVPAAPSVSADDVEIEAIELRDVEGDAPDDADGVEEWFR
ncbi:hypothetical protein [Dokdonella sp.]|uniref:hypothetical protein n=1 Tax=Dokdonella sp. TaxID=2291710 RepID=UPI002F416C7F